MIDDDDVDDTKSDDHHEADNKSHRSTPLRLQR